MDIELHPHYITDEAGKRISVVLPIEEYEALILARLGMDETAYLLSIPGMQESIREGMETPVDQCTADIDILTK